MTLAANWQQQWMQPLIRKAMIEPAYAIIAPLTHYGDEILERAYDYCAEVTREHSKTFYMTSSLLGGAGQKAARAMYAFCRVSDDLIDQGDQTGLDKKIRKLEIWKRDSLREDPHPDDLVALAWADTRSKFGIPKEYAEQLLEGVAQDLFKTRYQNFVELAHYCYGVASTVGLMSMHLVGYSGPEAIPYAIKLGVALQITNILRDVGEDWDRGRLYLPQDELLAFGLTEADIARGQVTEKWRKFMRFQIERTRRLYRESIPGISMLKRKGRFAIMASAALYQSILEQIEQNDYDVFNQRAMISQKEKISRLPGIWWRSVRGKQQLGYLSNLETM